ncbi:MAG: DNA-binding response regulator [Polyangiaceae bacterium]
MRKIGSALLIDDDDGFRVALQGALRRRGLRALTAATVSEALHILEDAPIDLVAIDFRMPETDGLQAIAKVRALQPDAVIVMITGFGDIPLTVAAMREGADTLLTKPVDADRLLEEARACAERAAPSSKRSPDAGKATYRLDELERETIEKALNDAGGVVATAAKMLGIDRRTLQRKMRRTQ